MAEFEQLYGCEDFDVVIIGAGLSGIDAAYHLRRHCPGKSFVVLEKRNCLGGTWSLFQYPGIRSDSDMYTFGFSWKPWLSGSMIAPASDILAYLTDAVAENGLAKHIRYGVGVERAAWSSEQQRWLITCGGERSFTCRFVISCAGYYSCLEPDSNSLSRS
jgi:monooxygenase